jgi:peptide alpha-N-acetyltransferase
MIKRGCHEVFLETEVTNHAALRLYEKLGFAREERLLKYYLNGHDAFRLKLWLTRQEAAAAELTEGQTPGSSGEEPSSGSGTGGEPHKGDRGEQVNGSAEAEGAAAIMKQAPS